jgi:hypothetical protein
MKYIGRPTDEELDRIEELAEAYFLGEWWTVEAKLWDDGDVHLEAFCTLGTSFEQRYDNSVRYHRQVLRYERSSNSCTYINKVSRHGESQAQYLKEKVINW